MSSSSLNDTVSSISKVSLMINQNDDSEEIIEKYINFLKKANTNNLRENKNSIFNMKIAYEKKSFNQTINRIVSSSTLEYMYWKDYLFLFFNKYHKRNFSWALPLMEEFTANTFPTELNYVSIFFWEEQSLRLNNKSDKFIESFNNGGNGFDRLNSSFCSVNLESVSFDDPAQEYKDHRKMVKIYSNIFKSHIFKSDHPIKISCDLFVKHYSVYLNQLIINLNDKNEETQLNMCEEAIKIVQKFIIKLQTSMKLMYSKKISYKFFNEERDELLNLTTNLVFDNKDFYGLIYKITKISTLDRVRLFEEKLKKNINVNPQDLGINQKFCLNEVTLNYQNLLRENDKASFLKNQNRLNENQERISLNNLKAGLNGNDKNSANNLNEYNQNIDEDTVGKREIKIISRVSDVNSPQKQGGSYLYERAVQTLKLIKNYQSPFEKLLLISSISSEITECVNEFWKDIQSIISNSLLNIDADELMSIFIFLIYRSQLKSLVVHLKMIKDFTSNIVRSSMIGYYFVTLEASILFILDHKENGRGMKNKSFIGNENRKIIY